MLNFYVSVLRSLHAGNVGHCKAMSIRQLYHIKMVTEFKCFFFLFFTDRIADEKSQAQL